MNSLKIGSADGWAITRLIKIDVGEFVSFLSAVQAQVGACFETPVTPEIKIRSFPQFNGHGKPDKTCQKFA